MSSFQILRVQSSPRGAASVSRQLGDTLIAEIRKTHREIEVVTRDVAQGVEPVNADWIGGAYIADTARTGAHRQALSHSDHLVAEIAKSDALIIEAPMYNFTVPATLKGWIDQICRSGVSFSVGPSGFKGLLKDRPTFVIVTTGGVPIGSPYDFSTPYLRHILGFIGITDVTFFDAAQLNMDAQKPSTAAEAIKAAIAGRPKLAA
jgi:FMN-dependent NADH-azoreductase